MLFSNISWDQQDQALYFGEKHVPQGPAVATQFQKWDAQSPFSRLLKGLGIGAPQGCVNEHLCEHGAGRCTTTIQPQVGDSGK